MTEAPQNADANANFDEKLDETPDCGGNAEDQAVTGEGRGRRRMPLKGWQGQDCSGNDVRSKQ